MIIVDRIKHIFGRHRYYKINRLSNNSHLLGCKFCKKKFVICTSTKTVLDYDLELENFYNET